MALDWRTRTFWLRAGWIATFLWVVFVWETTGGDGSRPLFYFIFIVPLLGWLAGLIVARLIARGGGGGGAAGRR